MLYDAAASKARATLSGTPAASRASRSTVAAAVLSGGADGVAKLWSTAAGGKKAEAAQLTLGGHAAAVTGVTLHATGDYAVTASADKSWGLHDLGERGERILSVGGAEAGYAGCAFHPDGLILGTAVGAAVRVWDVKSQANVATLEGHAGAVQCLNFSENGFYLATGAADGAVKLWDLRKIANFHELPQSGGPISAVHFDYAGQYLAVGAPTAPPCTRLRWSCLKTLDGGGATGVAFGARARARRRGARRQAHAVRRAVRRGMGRGERDHGERIRAADAHVPSRVGL